MIIDSVIYSGVFKGMQARDLTPPPGFMGPKVIVMYKNNHFCFKGSLTSVISSASYFKKPKIFLER